MPKKLAKKLPPKISNQNQPVYQNSPPLKLPQPVPLTRVQPNILPVQQVEHVERAPKKLPVKALNFAALRAPRIPQPNLAPVQPIRIAPLAPIQPLRNNPAPFKSHLQPIAPRNKPIPPIVVYDKLLNPHLTPGIEYKNLATNQYLHPKEIYTPGVHYQRESSFKSVEIRKIFEDTYFVYNPAKQEIVNRLLQHPVSKQQGQQDLNEIIRLAGFSHSKQVSSDDDVLQLLGEAFRYYDTHYFNGSLAKEGDSILQNKKFSGTAQMWYNDTWNDIDFLRKLEHGVHYKYIVSKGTIEFFDNQRIREEYDYFNRNEKQIYRKNYIWEDYNHYILYICVHEIVHCLLSRYSEEESKNFTPKENAHNKLFWTLLQNLTGITMARVIADEYKNSVEIIHRSNDLPKDYYFEAQQDLFKDIRNNIQRGGMANADDVEDFAKQVFQELISIYS